MKSASLRRAIHFIKAFALVQIDYTSGVHVAHATFAEKK